MNRPATNHTTRRDLLIRAGATVVCGTMMVVTIGPADATPDAMQAAIRDVVGAAKVTKGRVTLDIPPLVENGNTVPITISIDSPMTAANYVKSVHVFNERNPQPNVIDIQLGPRAGKAIVSTRIRLADAQKVVVIAQLSDGSFWSDSADVIVTLAACAESNL
jgi:sulfur-oxidizing protein SoxY